MQHNCLPWSKLSFSIPESTERERLANLADQLEGPMQARGATLKQYLAHTIAPAGKKVKEVHTALEQKFDLGFGCVDISSPRVILRRIFLRKESAF